MLKFPYGKALRQGGSLPSCHCKLSRYLFVYGTYAVGMVLNIRFLNKRGRVGQAKVADKEILPRLLKIDISNSRGNIFTKGYEPEKLFIQYKEERLRGQ